MPADVRGIGRYINDVTRHRCGDSTYSYIWIGPVAEAGYDSSDLCPYCGTPRYVLVRERLKPQRLFNYFGAAKP